MRFDKMFLAATAVAVLTFFAGADAQAQSGGRGFSEAASVISGQFQGAGANFPSNFASPGFASAGFASPNAGSVVQSVAQGTGYVQGFPQGGTSTYVDSPTLYAPEYPASPATYHSQVATQHAGCKGCRGKGKVSTGQIAGGCLHCAKEAPIRTAQDYSAVPSCCGTLGQLDIPSLFTPPRLDRAPIGAAVGRPLFGQWQGY